MGGTTSKISCWPKQWLKVDVLVKTESFHVKIPLYFYFETVFTTNNASINQIILICCLSAAAAEVRRVRVALLLSVAGLVVGPQVTSESKIGGTDSAALRTSWTCLRLSGSCVTSCTSFFRGSDPAIYEAPETTITDSSPYISVACQSLQVTWLNVALEEICFDVVDEAFISKSEKLSFVVTHTHTYHLTALFPGLPG